MSATTIEKRDAAERLVRAIEMLDSLGYACWLLEEFAVESLRIHFHDIPNDIPLLPGEVELFAGIQSEILALADWTDGEAVDRPKCRY